MKTITFVFLIIFSVVFSFNIKAQSLHLISDTQIFLEPTSPHVIDTLMMSDPASMEMELTGFDDSEEFKLSVSVLLLDTVEISKVYVKVGRAQGGDDLFNSFFEYDDYTLATGVSYVRNKKHVVLGLGNFINLRNIYTEIYIENTSGSTTQLVLNHINQ
jgi:hypothetical protein